MPPSAIGCRGKQDGSKLLGLNASRPMLVSGVLRRLLGIGHVEGGVLLLGLVS